MEEKSFSAVWQGWQCPICKRVYSPFTKMCLYCGNQETGTNICYPNAGGFVKEQSSAIENQTPE